MRALAGWRHFAALALLAVPALLPAQDELGLGKMWTFEKPPLGYLQREYGFQPDEAWWNRMRLASLRFGKGCSASFVSAQGLILTNHHCVRDQIAAVQGEHDWVRDGFVAGELAGEVRLPGLTVQQLVRMTDVTARVDVGVGVGIAPEQAEQQREKNRELLLAEARAAQPDLEPQLVKLFHGAQWQLYQYRVFDDIRLVMAPHLQISHFGGDPDNFVYPRYAIDFSFCRAYVDGKPADTSAFHFPFSDGPDEGELVFLTGNPGTTQRLLTVAQLEFLRDVRYPRISTMFDSRLAVLRAFTAKDAAMEKRLRTSILSLENGQKLYRGELSALTDAQVMGRKRDSEAAFQKRAEQRGHAAELQVWRQLAELMHQKRELDAPFAFHSAGGLPLLLRALALVEWAHGGDARLLAKAKAVECCRDAVPEALFADHLARARAALGRGDRYVAALLGEREPQAAVAALVEGSKLADAAAFDALVAGGKSAIDASADPALVAARTVFALNRESQQRIAAVEEQETRLGSQLAKLLFAVYGHDVTPDATFTLRWSDGRVAGYPCNGSLAPWRTVFHGLFARAAEFDDKHPFDLPAPWLLAKDRLDLRAPVDFVCTVDSTGGNSGSPVVDRELQLVGLLFDGNIESMANEFIYGERTERSVCVHPQAITEALGKVYGATRLLRELTR